MGYVRPGAQPHESRLAHAHLILRPLKSTVCLVLVLCPRGLGLAPPDSSAAGSGHAFGVSVPSSQHVLAVLGIPPPPPLFQILLLKQAQAGR